jgi:hypothetical protein
LRLARRHGREKGNLVIRIAASARAYRALKASLPAGSTVYPPERNARGQ